MAVVLKPYIDYSQFGPIFDILKTRGVLNELTIVEKIISIWPDISNVLIEELGETGYRPDPEFNKILSDFGIYDEDDESWLIWAQEEDGRPIPFQKIAYMYVYQRIARKSIKSMKYTNILQELEHVVEDPKKIKDLYDMYNSMQEDVDMVGAFQTFRMDEPPSEDVDENLFLEKVMYLSMYILNRFLLKNEERADELVSQWWNSQRIQRDLIDPDDVLKLRGFLLRPGNMVDAYDIIIGITSKYLSDPNLINMTNACGYNDPNYRPDKSDPFEEYKLRRYTQIMLDFLQKNIAWFQNSQLFTLEIESESFKNSFKESPSPNPSLLVFRDDENFIFSQLRESRDLLMQNARDARVKGVVWLKTAPYFVAILFQVSKLLSTVGISEAQEKIVQMAGFLCGARTDSDWIDRVQPVFKSPTGSISTSNLNMMTSHPNRLYYIYGKKGTLNQSVLKTFLSAWALFANISILVFQARLSNLPQASLKKLFNETSIKKNLDLMKHLKGGIMIGKLWIDNNKLIDYDGKSGTVPDDWDITNTAPLGVNLLECAEQIEQGIEVKECIEKIASEMIDSPYLPSTISLDSPPTKWAIVARILHNVKYTNPVSDKICRILQSQII